MVLPEKSLKIRDFALLTEIDKLDCLQNVIVLFMSLSTAAIVKTVIFWVQFILYF